MTGLYDRWRVARERRRIARTHKWASEYRPTSTAVPGSDGWYYAQHVYVCERCGLSQGATVHCSGASRDSPSDYPLD